MDQLLKSLNVKYEDLNDVEKSQYQLWMDQLTRNVLTVEDVKQHIGKMLDGVESELESTPAFKTILGFIEIENPKDIFLKARMRNYRLLLGFLEGPAKAKASVQAQINQATQAAQSKGTQYGN